VAEAWRVLEDSSASVSARAASEAPAAPAAAEPPDRSVRLLLTLGIGVVVAVAVWLLMSGMSDGAVAINTTHQSGAPGGAGGTATAVARASAVGSAASSGDLVVVEVNGAVRKPGVYRLPAGSRVGDAIEAAGGYGSRVDAAAAQALNLAARLEDGKQIHVPARGEAALTNGATVPGAGPIAGAGAGSGAASGPVNINSASAAQLDALPGIGPATSAKIIAARTTKPFSSIDDLRARKIVGPSTLEKIRDLVVVR
jgi:competence protein ComEA